MCKRAKLKKVKYIIVFLIVIIPVLFSFVFSKQDSKRSSKEIIDEKFELMRTYSIEELYNSLEKASKNYKEGNQWDFDIIIPMHIIIKDREDSYDCLIKIFLDEERYNTYIRKLAIEGLGDLERYDKIKEDEVIELINIFVKYIDDETFENEIRQSLAKILSSKKLLVWLNNAKTTEDKWRIINYFNLVKPTISISLGLHDKVKEMIMDKNEDLQIRLELINHIVNTFCLNPKYVIDEFKQILNDENEPDVIKNQVKQAIEKLNFKE